MGKTTLKATASKDELAKQKSLEEESPDDAGVKEPSKASTSTRPSINKQCKEKDYKAKHDGTEERAGSSWTENYKRALVSTQEIAKLQAQKPTTAPNEDKRRQRPPNCPERYGNALMSDRSPDHVGLSYFDGLPWDKPDAKLGSGRQPGQKNVGKEDMADRKENSKEDKKDRGKDTDTNLLDDVVPPW